jgi:hypothetical protein
VQAGTGTGGYVILFANCALVALGYYGMSALCPASAECSFSNSCGGPEFSRGLM